MHTCVNNDSHLPELMGDDRVTLGVGDMCVWDRRADKEDRDKRRTWWISSSLEIVKVLDQRCEIKNRSHVKGTSQAQTILPPVMAKKIMNS